jgi:hypothetical protein
MRSVMENLKTVEASSKASEAQIQPAVLRALRNMYVASRFERTGTMEAVATIEQSFEVSFCRVPK